MTRRKSRTTSAVPRPAAGHEAMGSLVPSADTSSTRFYFGSLSRQLVTTERADIESLAWHGRGTQVVVE